MENAITWITCDGGPHILMEGKSLKIWKGESEEAYQESMRYYEQACMIDSYIGELNIDSGKCIIIGDDVSSSTWIANGDANGAIVVCNYMDEEITYDVLATEIRKIPSCRYHDTGLSYDVTDAELYLFSACDFGADWLYHYLKFNLIPGKYKIRMIEEYIFHNCSFRLFGFLSF